MQPISRRALLASSALAATRAADAEPAAAPPPRRHPLEGIARENLKITDLRVTLLSVPIPPERQWLNPRTVAWKSDACMIQVFTDRGIVGLGESDPLFEDAVQMKDFAERYIRPALLGRNPFDVDLLAGGWSAPGRQPRGVTAWAGVDIALWDIVGKAKGQPVYKLISVDGAPQRRIRLYASGGDEYAWYKRPEALIDEALRAKQDGFTAYKFRPGTSWEANAVTVPRYAPLVRKMREAVGPDFQLIQEANQRLTFEECMELAPVLEELRFLWFEEPCPAGVPAAIDNYLAVRKAMPHVMLSGSEKGRNRFEFKDWIDRRALDVVQPDCSRTGLTEAWHIARLAALQDIYCCPHDWNSGADHQRQRRAGRRGPQPPGAGVELYLQPAQTGRVPRPARNAQRPHRASR